VLDPEVIDVRAEERLDTAALEPYLREHLHEPDGAFTLRQFGGGHANLTYLIAFGQREYVLRRPPLGPVPPNAHDMRREHRVLSRLHRAFPLAPQAYLLCTDASIAGADFLVEERKHGLALRRDLPPALIGDETFSRRLTEAIVDTLAQLHAVDPAGVDLAGLGKPEGYVQRQLDGWIERWERARTSDTANVDKVAEWLRSELPPSPRASFVHNDYKLDNMLVDAGDPARITALLDWDMCTLGDPLMDLGYMLALWPEPHDPQAFRKFGMPTWHAGSLTRKQATMRYAERSGTDVSHVLWYYVFNIFRFAAILQQIYARYDRGQTTDPRFAAFGTQANALVAIASALPLSS
jgi:aminoglycoside phosphotransferase (APT) family kinase protein